MRVDVCATRTTELAFNVEHLQGRRSARWKELQMINRKGRMAIALVLSIPSVAAAQDMRPLHELAPDATRDYPFVRCGGLYQAFFEWVGAERMGEAAARDTEAALKSNLSLAVLIRIKDGMGGSAEHVTEVTLRDARNVADLYLKRLEANFASQGQAFASDPVVRSDLELCTAVTEFAADAGSNSRAQ